MTDIDTNMNRRDFLRGAALLAGATVLAANAGANAEAAAPAPHGADAAPRAATTLLFWDGRRLRDPATLPAVPAFGPDARVSVHGHSRPDGGAPRLAALTAHFAVRTDDGGLAEAPFHAWTAAAHVARPAVWTMPADPARGLRLSVTHAGGGKDALTLTPGTVGTWVLADGIIDGSACRLDPARGLLRRTLSGFQPVAFEYLLLTVASV